MVKELKLTHARLVAYLAAGVVEQSISKNLDVNYTEVIDLIDNATCDLADEQGNIKFSDVLSITLKKKLNGILPSDFLDHIINEASAIIWMYSQDF